jgi:hypothetical protein
MSGDVDTGQGAAASQQPTVAAAIPAPGPTPIVAAAEATHDHPAGTAAQPGGAIPVIGPADKPELAVGAAFAGGLVLAFILKRIAS